jgi:ABC-type molybdenum transport system ATPase subunit/photorepair protein PhrA
LIAAGAVAGGGPSQRRFAGLPHGGKSRKVHRLEMRKITKYFPGVKALSDVDFRLMKGEVHAIVGQNGDGRSSFREPFHAASRNGD